MADDDLLRRLDATLARNAQAFEDLQVVIRDSAVRAERVFQLSARQIEANTAQIRAQTEAIWRMLDRWGEGPTPTS